jgi:hypothetical protein
MRGGGARGRVKGAIGSLRRRYAGHDHYAAVVEVRGGGRSIRSTLVGHGQAEATAVGVAAITEALWGGEVTAPGVWLAEQVIAPEPFLARLAAHGIVPLTDEVHPTANGVRASSSAEAPLAATHR